MVGPLVGPTVGPIITPYGRKPTGGGLSGVTRDATSGIYCPATAAEWALMLAAAGIASGGPSFLWLLQDASGSPADQIGGAPLTVSATAPIYQATISGWARKGIAFTDGVTSNLSRTTSPMPDAGGTSGLILAYMEFTAANAGGRNVLAWGGSVADRVQYISGNRLSLSTSVGAAGTYNYVDGATHPVLLRNDAVHGSVSFYTDKDKVAGTYQACVGVGLYLGGDTVSGPVVIPYSACFTGAAAQLTDAQVKTLLQTLGWSPSWT